MLTKKINELLRIDESYKAPQKMMELLFNPSDRNELFQKFLEIESDLSYEWFQGYFEDEHSERKAKKQDFTPRCVSELLAKLGGCGDSYFESAAGTGGIMIQFWNSNPEAEFVLEELSDRSIPFLLFNMMIREMSGYVVHGDSLTKETKKKYRVEPDSLTIIENIETKKNQIVLMNPPYSASWSMDKSYMSDPRFSSYEALAPKSKADYAFLLHGYYQLAEGGLMALVLPHGVLFRGASEGTIRKKLLEIGAIDTIIGLPAKLFRNTDIPTTILVLKKNRTEKDVLFIDASKEFEKGKNHNSLKPEHIKKIIETYTSRENKDKYAHVASFEEIVENDYNLNIPRYVDTFEEEEPIDVVKLSAEMIEIDCQIEEIENELLKMLDELTGDDEVINATKSIFSNKRAGQMNLF